MAAENLGKKLEDIQLRGGEKEVGKLKPVVQTDEERQQRISRTPGLTQQDIDDLEALFRNQRGK